jgi:hypothetical protein
MTWTSTRTRTRTRRAAKTAPCDAGDVRADTTAAVIGWMEMTRTSRLGRVWSEASRLTRLVQGPAIRRASCTLHATQARVRTCTHAGMQLTARHSIEGMHESTHKQRLNFNTLSLSLFPVLTVIAFFVPIQVPIPRGSVAIRASLSQCHMLGIVSWRRPAESQNFTRRAVITDSNLKWCSESARQPERQPPGT